VYRQATRKASWMTVLTYRACEARQKQKGAQEQDSSSFWGQQQGKDREQHIANWAESVRTSPAPNALGFKTHQATEVAASSRPCRPKSPSDSGQPPRHNLR
jgi:hypothetical protein